MLTNFLNLVKIREFLRTLTRNSSGDETANVNFLYDDIVHVDVLQSTAPPPPQTVQHGVVTAQPEANRQNITVK